MGRSFTPDRSHKLERLGEMAEVIESGESALIFTQFTDIGAALEPLVFGRTGTTRRLPARRARP